MNVQIIKLFTGSFIFMFSTFCSAQDFVFETSVIDSLNQKMLEVSRTYQSKGNVNNIYSLETNSNVFNSKRISFRIDNNLFSATLTKKITRNKDNFTWFGKTNEGKGVFFYVKNGKIASKFDVGEYSYTLIPISSNNHLLIEFNNTFVGDCGDGESMSINPMGKKQVVLPLNDNGCKLRVLIATTPTGRTEIINSGFDIPTFAQVTIDEANLAYISSQINITMELAVLLETTYTENSNMQTDVNRFRNGTNGLSTTHTYRNLYQTDLQILIRRDHPSLAGIAYNVPTSSTSFNQTNGFCVVAVNGVTTGRFSFTHEIGHLQGARHENHNASPSYARGFLSNSTTNWRTIMTRQAAASCSQSNACRIGVFSNPDINGLDGTPAGTNDRDNARRLSETANIISNYRQTPSNLLFSQNETISANYVSNHLANNRIDTNNKNIIYQNNSIGTMRAESEIVLKPGFTAKSGSNFRAYISNNTCENLPSSRQSKNSNLLNIMHKDKFDIQIYPNPTNDIINISFNQEMIDFTIEMYNETGNKIYTKRYNNITKKTTIDIREFKSSVYIIKLIDKNNITTRKIIKK